MNNEIRSKEQQAIDNLKVIINCKDKIIEIEPTLEDTAQILLDYTSNLEERNNNQQNMLTKIFQICYGDYSCNKKIEIIRAILNRKEDEIFYE